MAKFNFGSSSCRILFANGTDVIHANQKMGELMGISSELALGESWIDRIFSEDQNRVLTRWKVAANEYSTVSFQCRITTPEAYVRWVQVQVIPLRTLEGQVIGILAAFYLLIMKKASKKPSKRKKRSLRYQKKDKRS